MRGPIGVVCVLVAVTSVAACGARHVDEAPQESADELRDLDAQEAEFLRLINEYRASKGLRALVATRLLDQVAYDHSLDMATHAYFDHNDQQGKTPFDRMRAAGYSGGWMAENIAAGNASAAATFDQWKNSPGHDANMLGTHYVAIGIGRATAAGSPYGWYWTTDFGDVVDSTGITPGGDAGVDAGPSPDAAADAAPPDAAPPDASGVDAGCNGTVESEPNDAYTSPNALAAAMCGAIGSASDQDWFTWSVAGAGVTYDVAVQSAGDADLQMWKLVNGQYAHIRNTTPAEIRGTSSGAGTYVLVVHSASGTPQPYRLALAR